MQKKKIKMPVSKNFESDYFIVTHNNNVSPP